YFTMVALPRKTLQLPVVSLDSGLYDAIRHYCDVGWLVCCRAWTAVMGPFRHVENGGRNLSCAGSGALVDSDRVCLRLCSLPNCLLDFYVAHYSQWPCRSSAIRRSFGLSKERVPSVRAGQP